ncbi:MAG: response regulator [Krumholzibacteria bacterium]|nr:response regulator [Candidatus Krumholzibacteria bacterium]
MTEPRLLRVLVADDEEGIRAGVARVLGGLTVDLDAYGGPTAFAVETVPDGLAARERLAQGGIDILLLDHSMPGLTGMELLEELRAGEAGTLVIMITAYASLDMAVRATKQGAFDFLGKPFTPHELRDVAAKAARHLVADRAARELAAGRRRVRFEFLSVLAHELKAPLGAVEGYLQLLDEGVAGDDPAAVKRIVGRSLARLAGMRKLIFDLLDLTRIESGEKARSLGPVDVAGAAGAVVETFAPAAAGRRLTVELRTAGDPVVTGDAGELEIMLNNLVSNAVKYNRDGGRVEVAVDGTVPDTVTITVADTGIGMSADEVSRLFGEFVRIKNEQTRTIEGSGLGLSILRRLARLNGGDVTVTSCAGQGSTFTLTLARGGTRLEAAR